MHKFVSFLYSLLIGISLAVFVGLGVYAFHPGPQHDKSCYDGYDAYNYSNWDDVGYNDRKNKLDACLEEREIEQINYARTVASVAIIASFVVTVGAVVTPIKISQIKDGVALGGVLVSGYSAIWAGIANHRILLFFSATALLVSSIAAGYSKFKK